MSAKASHTLHIHWQRSANETRKLFAQ